MRTTDRGRGDPMTLDAPGDGGARYWLLGFNPAAKLIAALVLAVGLVPAVDAVTGGVVLAAVLPLVLFSGADRRTLLVLGVPFLFMGLSSGLVNLLYGEAGPLGALGAAVRLLAIALPGILAAVSSDPTETADSLVQRLRIPERPAMGVLAALRLIPLLAGQWRTITLARRARGLEAGHNPVAMTALFFGRLFALLVRSIRTGTLLATAMDARAFGTGPRSHARTSRWRPADTLLVAACPVLLAAAYAVSAGLGTLTLLFG
ncbi:energy-coupling factor transporter transmembrane component T family protein [Actinorugispora endophytica]|uniref:Energy-coupling factor transport system permease protein n=1 Tax=Actinorugispora endophytica TaxID=1605990 RepID=A0A4R6V4F7_9ACTN|nr:energy-coupling factor transporter transmembrane component T [Actinorugispora endophytica]TDQ53606.1 energy-coupling factor transport system permease protein [Actinorugispora endophytica]